MRFQFQYEYSLKDLEALSRVTGKLYRRWKNWIYRILLAVLTVGYLVLGILAFAGGGWIPGLILILVGVFFGAVAVLYHQGSALRSRRMLLKGMGSITVELTEEGIRGQSGKGEDHYPYSSVIGACHYGGCYFLFLDERHAILLPERAQTQGDPVALKIWLEEKLGKEIVEVR
ncbi:MAG: YcxB family protein [Oscillospiraceae bacterium]|nr:YcxB family protein [Oscillospiraceae bacterium]